MLDWVLPIFVISYSAGLHWSRALRAGEALMEINTIRAEQIEAIGASLQ